VNETVVTVVGRVISTPEHRRTQQNDVEVTNFRMASNERRYDKDLNDWVDGDSFYVDVTCWRRLAFGVHACLDKGDPVIVTGRLYTHGFEVEGKRRSVTKLDAYSIGPDLARCTATVHRRREVRTDQVEAADQQDLAELAVAA
jgi:single-strand DNA-binding protein